MKKKLLLITILLLTVVFIPVKAENLIAPHENDVILTPEKEKSNFIADNSVKTDKLIDGTAFIAGNTVNVESPINGAAFVAGNNVNLSSTQDILFVAGNNISLENINTKDAFVAGSNINIKSSLIRDLYVAGSDILIDSNVSRNAYVGGDTVTIDSNIAGNLDVDASTIILKDGASIGGTLKYPKNAKITIAKDVKINKTKTYNVKSNSSATFMSKVTDQAMAYLSMLLIGIILLALNKKVFSKIEKIKKELNVLAKEFGIGFAFLVVVPIAAIIAMMTVIGVPLSIIVLMLYGIMIYLSIIPTAYYLGYVCLHKQIKNKFGFFAIALLCLYVLRLIPVIGGLVSFISLCFGLGVYTDLLLKQVKGK